MIDTFAIVTTTIAVIYVLLRAAAFDRTLPWFETIETSSKSDLDAARTGTAKPDHPSRTGAS